MNENQLIAMGTIMIAFSTIFGVLIALISLLVNLFNLNLLQTTLYAIIYIDINLKINSVLFSM